VTPSSMTVWGSGMGIVGFEFAEIGADRTVSWLRTADCKPRQIKASTPLVSPITNTHGTDPLLLTAGDWKVTALTDFTEDSCDGVGHALQATLVIHVVA
jgi:hypothetical protein